MHRIFSSSLGLAVSPYLEIEDEVRVVLIDHHPVVVYGKDRPAVTGDGKHSLLELALAATPTERRSTVLPGMRRAISIGPRSTRSCRRASDAS